MEEAVRRSRAVIRSLLHEARSSPALSYLREEKGEGKKRKRQKLGLGSGRGDDDVVGGRDADEEEEEEEEVTAQLVRFSIMWTPTRIVDEDQDDNESGSVGVGTEAVRGGNIRIVIAVREHVISAGEVLYPLLRTSPIVVSLAM